MAKVLCNTVNTELTPRVFRRRCSRRYVICVQYCFIFADCPDAYQNLEVDVSRIDTKIYAIIGSLYTQRKKESKVKDNMKRLTIIGFSCDRNPILAIQIWHDVTL